ATGIEGKLVKARNRRSLSTSSSQSLLKKSLSIKPRALSNLYPSNLLSATEGDTNISVNNRSSFEDFDYSTSGNPFTGTNSGSNSSSSSSNSPYLSSFPFYQRERHHSLFSTYAFSSSVKRKPSFQRCSRFFPDLSIDAEQNHLSNLHIIDDGSPEFTFPKVKRKLLKDLEEAKSRADKRIMMILDNWYKSHQYQELLSEFLYDGWSDDDDMQAPPLKIQKSSSQRTLSKMTVSPAISDTDDEASPLNKLFLEAKLINKDELVKDKITHKMESMSLHGNTKPKNITKRNKNFKKRMTAIYDLLHFNVAIEIMKELQELMESQRKMAV
ncbi:1158_t:CDS:2, partial [Scutellospora calospora]